MDSPEGESARSRSSVCSKGNVVEYRSRGRILKSVPAGAELFLRETLFFYSALYLSGSTKRCIIQFYFPSRLWTFSLGGTSMPTLEITLFSTLPSSKGTEKKKRKKIQEKEKRILFPRREREKKRKRESWVGCKASLVDRARIDCDAVANEISSFVLEILTGLAGDFCSPRMPMGSPRDNIEDRLFGCLQGALKFQVNLFGCG